MGTGQNIGDLKSKDEMVQWIHKCFPLKTEELKCNRWVGSSMIIKAMNKDQ